MSWKKFGEGVLKGVKVASQFSPLLAVLPMPGASIIAGGLRIAARIEPEDAEPFIELTQYIAEQIRKGVPEDERLRADATALYINRVKEKTGNEPPDRNVGLAYYSALAHVRGELGLDAIEDDS